MEESSLETRLKLQQENQIGLYSIDYESKEKLVKTEKQETPEFLPSGFKKTNSWISVDHKSEKKVLDFSYSNNPPLDANESKEDLDGEPLPDNASKAEEESEEDIDGEPLPDNTSKAEESEEDLDGEPLPNNVSKAEESEEDIDGEPLFRFSFS